jgi:hypothetical protein
MITTLSEYYYIACKDYDCVACIWLNEVGRIDFFNLLSEYRSYLKAKSNGFKIREGEKYIVQNNVDNGTFYVFKAIPEIHDICLKYDLYPKD